MSNDVHPEPYKKLRRGVDDKMLAGVCAGWARYLGVDTALLRILVATATIIGVGTPVLIYLACWILMPREHAEVDRHP